MKTRYALIIGAVVIVAAYVVMSFMGVSVDSSGQFSRLDDGQMLYTHHLTNLTWHPIRYTVAADPGSQVQTTLVRWDSSDPENTTPGITVSACDCAAVQFCGPQAHSGFGAGVCHTRLPVAMSMAVRPPSATSGR